MASYDADIWRARVSFRLEQELALDKKDSKAIQRYGEDIVAIEAMDRLESWLNRRGIRITFAPDRGGGLWHRDKKMIRVNSRSRPREQYHIMLHECGHVIVDLSSASHSEGKYAAGYEAVIDLKDKSQRKHNTTFKHRVDVLAEEIDAWHAGKKLAKRLGLYLDLDAYDKSRVSKLKSYVKWSLQRQPDDPDPEDE